MKTNINNWEKIEKSLKQYGYKKEAIKKIKENKTLPPTYKIFELQKYGIPWSFWEPYIEKYIERKACKKANKD